MGNRLSKIYTRTGDDGSTGLGDGTRVPKDSARVAAYGTVDEANSCIGLLLATDLPDDVRELLTSIQHQLFDLGGELCIPGHAAIGDGDVERLERHLDGRSAYHSHRGLAAAGEPFPHSRPARGNLDQHGHAADRR